MRMLALLLLSLIAAPAYGQTFFVDNHYAVTHSKAIPLPGLSGCTINLRTGNVVVLSEGSGTQFAEVDELGNILSAYTISGPDGDWESLKYVSSDVDGRDWYLIWDEDSTRLRYGSVAPGATVLVLSEFAVSGMASSTEAMGYEALTGKAHIHTYRFTLAPAAVQLQRLAENNWLRTEGPYTNADISTPVDRYDNYIVADMDFIDSHCIRVHRMSSPKQNTYNELQEFNLVTGKVMTRQRLTTITGSKVCEGLAFRDVSKAYVCRDVVVGTTNFYVLTKQ